jgi:O-antigen/teichoic acid export membrane protein
MIGRGVAAVLTFTIPIVLARALDPHAYGTYKQFFLIASTVYLVAQAGLTASLYYFVPRHDTDERARYVVQALIGLLVLGGLAAAGIFVAADALGRRFSNPALAGLAAPLALYLWAYMAAAPLEVGLTSIQRTGWAGISYITSDVVRTAALILPIVLGGGMVGLAWAAAAFAALRLVAAWALTLSGGLGRPRAPDRAAVMAQLRYSLPFAGAVLLATAQMQLPQYTVAALTDAATYAVYSVGILQIPLTDMLYTPVAEVMMVRLAASDPAGAPPIFREAVARLALFFLPLCAFALAAAPQLIPTLYTPVYIAAVPIFIVALVELPLSALPVDGLLRSLDLNGTLFRVGSLRLCFAIVAVPVGLMLLGLPGAMLGYVVTQWLAKLVLMRAAARYLGVPAQKLVPWREVSAWALRSLVIFGAVTLVRVRGPWRSWAFLAVATVVGGLVWGACLVTARELRRKRPAAAPAPSFPPAPPADGSYAEASLG